MSGMGAFDAADSLAAFNAPSTFNFLLTSQVSDLMPVFVALTHTAASTPPPTALLDPSGNPISTAEALDLLRATLWRM